MVDFSKIFTSDHIIMMVVVATIVFFGWILFVVLKSKETKRRISNYEVWLKLYEGLINLVKECALLVDEAGIIQTMNDQCLNYSGKTAEKMIGKSIQRLQTDYMHSDHREAFKKAMSETGIYEFDIKYFHNSGDIIPFHVVVNLIAIENKKNEPQTFYCVTAVDLKTTNEKDDYINQQQDELLEIQHLAKLGYWKIDYLTKKIYWSRELYSILGYEEGEVEPTLDIIYSMAYEDDQNRVWKAFLSAFQNQKKVDTQYRIKNNRGEIRDIYLRIRHFFSDGNEHLRTIGILQDITAQVDLREELNAQLTYTDTVLNNCSLLYIECNSDFQVSSINNQVSHLIGINNEAARGKQLLDVFGKLNRTHRKFVEENMNFKKPMPIKDYTGDIHYIQWDHATFTKKNNEFANILLGIDISETIKKRKALEESFALDPITKLPNRYKLDQVLDNYFEKNGKRQDKHLVLLFIHIKGLFVVADGFGQSAEDQVIRLISERLYSAIGKYGLFVRRYANQFVLFYPCDIDEERTIELCKLITELLKIPFTVKDSQIKLGSHIGVSKFPEHASFKEDLVRFASAAMHEAQHLNVDYYFYNQDLELDVKEKMKKYRTINY
ncbi:diguanylate cyclase [Acetobacterium paludosum]|uniref:Diguanylate cyclase n=1 Tax=Acetobacterium paludosum TaxID=52693 RepID=A0A923HXB7_9FIRM|nr:sensor domain-containing diguanylate cyclase [Acetobacterium paludosum]MBC3887696.1 diguanylate cyclase [Acetobacterium paludosum]